MDEIKAILDFLNTPLPSREECALFLRAHDYIDALQAETNKLADSIATQRKAEIEQEAKTGKPRTKTKQPRKGSDN